MSDSGFLRRWARRKAQADSGQAPPTDRAGPQAPDVPPLWVPPPEAAPAGDPAGLPAAADSPAVDAQPAGQPPAAKVEPLPSLDSLSSRDDFAPFMRAGVDSGTRNAALRTLFADPHFNVMDGLDIYIDDYSKPDPIPASMLRTLRQARTLGLVDDEEQAADEKRAAAVAAADPATAQTPTAAQIPEAAAETPGAVPPQQIEAGAAALPPGSADTAEPGARPAGIDVAAGGGGADALPAGSPPRPG